MISRRTEAWQKPYSLQLFYVTVQKRYNNLLLVAGKQRGRDISFRPISKMERSELSCYLLGEIMATTAYTVKKLGVMSVAWVGAVIGLVVGIVMALIGAVAGGAAATIAKSISGSIGVGATAGVGIFIALVLLGGVFGLICGAIVAGIYNFALGPTNGIEIELDIKK